MSRHIKHAKTTRTDAGHFGRFEMAIMGTPCSRIKKIARALVKHLNGLKVAYADADHHQSKTETGNPGHPFYIKYTDRISHREMEFSSDFNRFHRNMLFSETDVVLVNGNHFEASRQILVIDPQKPLEKKLNRITRPVMLLYQEKPFELPGYLQSHSGDIDRLPAFHVDDYSGISAEILSMVREETPRILGLVLAGGKSLRMGRDKGLIEYFGKPHREHLFQLLAETVEDVYYSVRPDQSGELAGLPVIEDSVSGLGPFGALISAFRQYPNHAWLVTATDLPLITGKTIQTLLKGRNPSKAATAFYNPETGFPEPLITIWEPKSYPALLGFLGLGYSCPRKVLINSDVELLQPKDPDVLKNVNDPESYENILKLLKK